jgi:uncharacterized protein YegP (UPF0339 family)
MSRGHKTVIYVDSRGEWRWKRVARNGEIIAVGEGHTRRADAERAAGEAFPDDEEAPEVEPSGDTSA